MCGVPHVCCIYLSVLSTLFQVLGGDFSEPHTGSDPSLDAQPVLEVYAFPWQPYRKYVPLREVPYFPPPHAPLLRYRLLLFGKYEPPLLTHAFCTCARAQLLKSIEQGAKDVPCVVTAQWIIDCSLHRRRIDVQAYRVEHAHSGGCGRRGAGDVLLSLTAAPAATAMHQSMRGMVKGGRGPRAVLLAVSHSNLR